MATEVSVHGVTKTNEPFHCNILQIASDTEHPVKHGTGTLNNEWQNQHIQIYWQEYTLQDITLQYSLVTTNYVFHEKPYYTQNRKIEIFRLIGVLICHSTCI